jgi:hypothetical protein
MGILHVKFLQVSCIPNRAWQGTPDVTNSCNASANSSMKQEYQKKLETVNRLQLLF